MWLVVLWVVGGSIQCVAMLFAVSKDKSHSSYLCMKA